MNINIRSNPMRKWFIWAIVMIGCLPINKALAQQSGDAERNTLRIMSYNIRNGRGMDEVTDLGRIADAICKVAPDVVAVQEVDSVTGNETTRLMIAFSAAGSTCSGRWENAP